MIDLHLSAFAPRWRFLYAVRIDAYGRKAELPALCFLNLSTHFYVWVTVWVRRLTHILTHTVSAKKVRKIPEIA